MHERNKREPVESPYDTECTDECFWICIIVSLIDTAIIRVGVDQVQEVNRSRDGIVGKDSRDLREYAGFCKRSFS
jgi:hypothetical protein